MVTFESDLDLRFVDGRTWIVLREFHTVVDGSHYTVPPGFATNFVSSPRFFWRIFPPVGRYGPAAVVHDYLYRVGSGVSRRKADRVFLHLMGKIGVPAWQRWPMYWAVRIFGRRHFGR